MQVTMAYVDTRFTQFLQKYTEVLKGLQFDDQAVAERTASLKHRLDTRDFRLYGERPINVLHGGKRITRYLIKTAIEWGPIAKARRERLLAEYFQRIAEARKTNPDGCFFSFESTYAKQLKVNLTPMSHLFRI
jgi:hypothetical protein